MNEKALEYLVAILKKNIGYNLTESEIPLLSSKIDELIRNKLLANYSDLISLIQTSTKSVSWQIIEALVFTDTSFSMDSVFFKEHASTIISKIYEKNNKNQRINILSVGCSSGQELYSIAMLFSKHKSYKHFNIKLSGIDVSTDSIIKAQKGCYTTFEIQNGLNARDMIDNFVFDGNFWQVKPILLENMDFRRINVYTDKLPDENYDLVLCRNFLKFFDGNSQLSILSKIKATQKAGDFLCLGDGENNLVLDRYYKTISGMQDIYQLK